MAAYFISAVTVHERTPAYAEYVRLVRPMIEKHGGEYLVRTGEFELHGRDARPDKLMIIRFPTRADLDAWYESEEYLRIKPYRLAATSAEIYIVEGE